MNEMNPPMRIGIYAELAKDEKPTGIGLHVRNLLDALAHIDRENEYLLYYQQAVLGRRTIPSHLPQQPNFRPRPIRFPARWISDRPRLWWDWYLPWVIRRDRVDIFHGPNHFLPVHDRGRNVVTIHDLAYFHMRVYDFNEVLKAWTAKALERAGAVIALSESTRRDIEALGVEPERIRVIYGGPHALPEDRIAYARAGELRQRLHLPERYVLFVGTLLPRKNVPFLLRSFARLKQTTDLPHGLVLAGHRDSASGEIDALVDSLGLTSEVTVTGYVEDWELPLLYKMADMFVLPTFYEGFGMVVQEAMHYGVPVIATDTSALHETVGDAALLVQVDDVEGLAQAMQRVLTDPQLSKELIARGQAQAQKFSWEKNARETLACYQALHKSARLQSNGNGKGK
jgi:glycosyltransferase involved in cell wall biosynthesis